LQAIRLDHKGQAFVDLLDRNLRGGLVGDLLFRTDGGLDSTLHVGIDVAAAAAAAVATTVAAAIAAAAIAATVATAPAVAAIATMATIAAVAAIAMAPSTTVAVTAVAAIAAAAAIATARITAAGETAKNKGRRLVFTADEGDSNQREKHRDTQNNNSVHPRILQLTYRYRKRELLSCRHSKRVPPRQPTAQRRDAITALLSPNPLLSAEFPVVKICGLQRI
jgi:hypothetical protein